MPNPVWKASLENEFSWSKSRDNLFKECLRAYYYNHYGSWGGWDLRSPPEIRELYIMKNLAQIPSWIGITVHSVAERAINSLKAGKEFAREDALRETKDRMNQEILISEQEKYRKSTPYYWGGKKLKSKGLQLHYYNEEVENGFLEDSVNQALACVENFYNDPVYKKLQKINRNKIRSVEILDSFIVEDVKVWVQLDAVVDSTKNDDIVIIDWKTGQSHQKDDISLQLGIYGFYGTQAWGVGVDKIRAYDVNLRTSLKSEHEITSERIEEVREYIKDSSNSMKSLLSDESRNEADISNFAQIESGGTCSRCRFRKACNR